MTNFFVTWYFAKPRDTYLVVLNILPREIVRPGGHFGTPHLNPALDLVRLHVRVPKLSAHSKFFLRNFYKGTDSGGYLGIYFFMLRWLT